MQARRMAIALSDELQERGTEALYGCVWQFGDLPANHRASRYGLEAPRMAIAVPGDLQESVRPGTDELQKSAGPRLDDLPESERPESTPAATLSQCSVATRVCLSWNKDFQLPRRYN